MAALVAVTVTVALILPVTVPGCHRLELRHVANLIVLLSCRIELEVVALCLCDYLEWSFFT